MKKNVYEELLHAYTVNQTIPGTKNRVTTETNTQAYVSNAMNLTARVLTVLPS